MEKLFGIPIAPLTTALIIILGIAGAVGLVVVLRNRVFFVMAARNIPRRRTQTVLIVLGLMLATLLFSAAFATGDTITHSIRVLALNSLGEVDIIISSQAEGAAGQFNYFDESFFSEVREELDRQAKGHQLRADPLAGLPDEHAPSAVR